MTEASETKKGFTIYRGKDAPKLMATGAMKVEPGTKAQLEGVMKAVRAGYMEGDQVKYLVQMPGFSLIHAWLKKNYPLSLHSHDSDCLYYIIAGSVRLGTEDLGKGDSFFVPAGVPYSYRPGADGVEVLEFRHETEFNFVNLSKTAAFWDKAAQVVADNVEDWRTASPPSETV